ncbi:MULTISPECIES: flagellar filament outer layer protein FlaA [unclassified Treponema]|uniref:flagellar filament outer layer protein FlaA n=1 Tax=unclassified Treponema TaxID=2638727 RepID=UPI0020A5C7A1|nr:MULTISPECIES: flagellar filament outer layer protein FlaA [unclassified Treponema]UTC68240.1 flagellar filament protein FlaA [Treponema sp. OMZ 789]UTC70960.1 flagellar filament protein FlaA [Treponema sp. OMZ 790]UTC73700.1 flagellar filament protein FlaA [Treponema sp. OMZ 791]
MKKSIAIILFLAGFVAFSFAQQNDNFSTIEAADPNKVGVDSAQQRIKEVSIEKFETEGTWYSMMSADEGVIRSRLFNGNPMNKKPIPAEEGLELTDEKVLGVKVSFYRRGHNSFEVHATKALPVEGIAKTASVWVVGRSYPHTMKLIVEDFWGKRFELYVGKLNHSGWKLMTVAIPPQNSAGKTGIIQKDYHYGTSMGLKIVGFRIECDPEEAYGHYYIYFDDLRVVSDLYEVDMRDEDDMSDNW